MPQVLIVDDEKPFLLSVTDGLSTCIPHVKVLTASDGQQALNILSSEKIDLLVTDLKMPVMDGFELLANVMQLHPEVPAIVMTAFGTPSIETKIRQIGTFPYLEKPLDLNTLAGRIIDELSAKSQGIIQGITLASFLQLIEIERKTFTLRITSEGRVGYLYFLDGSLMDAETGSFRAETAFYDILTWTNASFQITNSCRKEEKTIESSVTNLLLEYMRLLDEDAKTDVTLDLAKDEDNREAEGFDLDLENETTNGKELDMNNVKDCLQEAMQTDGALGVALGDWHSGMCLGILGINNPTYPVEKLEIAVAGNTDVIRAKFNAARSLGISDTIEDILITLKTQYHLMRIVENQQHLFFYFVLDRTKSNLKE